ncbi:MAG: hypothetical protein KC620_26205 [Myxococcales bacterium]|nr:hypothetical protein [Myxococcales bacterium]
MRAAALVCFLLALAVGGVWFAHGQHLGTLTEKLVQTKTTDDFGDEVIKDEWQPTFEIGLDIAGPAAGGLIGLAGLLLFLDRRKRKAAGGGAA